MQRKQGIVNSGRNSVLNKGGLIQIHKLQQNVLMIAQRNKEKYSQILRDYPGYNVLFYQPNYKLSAEKAFKKELYLKQLDKLMDQESIFDKKLAQLRFLKELESQEQEKVLDKEVNPYQALRTVWARHQKNAIEAKTSSDRLESLNYTIGMIKNTVMAMKLKEQNCTLSYPSPTQSLSNNNYEKLLQKYERSMMLNQDLRQEIIQLSNKINEKQEIESKFEEKLVEKDKEIKQLKKVKEMAEVDHKFVIAQLKQEIFLVEKKLEKLEKWKVGLSKNAIEQSDQKFKIYFEFTQQINVSNQNLSRIKATSKKLSDIVTFFTQTFDSTKHSSLASNNQSQILNLPSLDQENSQFIIPSLSFTEPNEESSTRKKMPTDRPLKTRNFQLQRFFGNKMGNVKLGKLPTQFNDESMKKFVRKNPILGSSRRCEPQNSERFFDQLSNTPN